MKYITKYWKLAKDNPKVTVGIIIGVIIIITWIK
jgi:hypothetical protein